MRAVLECVGFVGMIGSVVTSFIGMIMLGLVLGVAGGLCYWLADR